MSKRIRILLLPAAVAVVLAACGTAADPSSSDAPSTPPDPSSVPSTAPDRPSDPPSPSMPGAPVPSGTLTVADGAIADGPGVPLSEVLGGDLTNPVLVNGVLFLDEDGVVWMADSVLDASVPTFSDVRVQVANYPTDGPTWDLADAEITGLQEVNGIRFFEDTKLYGTITP